MFEGYFGYSLPDDLLSGLGLRAALSSITLGMPVIGTWLHWLLFGGDFPGTILIPGYTRYTSCCCRDHPGAHRRTPGVGVVPEAHPVPRPGTHRAQRHRRAVMPVFAFKSGAFFAAIVGVLGLMAACCRSTRSGTWGRTSHPRCRPARSRTST